MPPKKVSRTIVQEQTIDMPDEEEDDFFTRLFASVLEQFKRQKFCDVVLYAKEDSNPSRMKPIRCHSLILVSVVPALKELLLDSIEEAHLIIPDLMFSQIQKFIRCIYTGLIQTTDFTLEMSQSMASVFGMIDGSVYHVDKTPSPARTEAAQVSVKHEQPLSKTPKEKMVEIVFENNEALGGMQQYELILPTENELMGLGDLTPQQTMIHVSDFMTIQIVMICKLT